MEPAHHAAKTVQHSGFAELRHSVHMHVPWSADSK